MTTLLETRRRLFCGEHTQFRDTVARFIQAAVAPNVERWNQNKIVDRSFYESAAARGMLMFAVPEEYGGSGVDDFRFNAVINEEFGRTGHSATALGLALQNDLLSPYLMNLASDEQRTRWLPGMSAGTAIGAIAMTEPGAGSDLSGIRTRAVRDGDHYLINGSKTFISSGQLCDFVILAARTSDDTHKGLTLFLVDANIPGFVKGRNLDKLGLHQQDTSELSFADVRVPVNSRLGEEGSGFHHLMTNLPQERLSIATIAVAAAEGTLHRTLKYISERQAFGRKVGTFQNSRFVVAELATDLEIARVFIDHCVDLHTRGELSAVQAAKAKWWTTELQVRVADRCLQLHGGYGYMREYQVSNDYVDARVQTIYGGTTEIMKEIIGRDLGL